MIKYIQYLFLILIISSPINLFAGPPIIQSQVDFLRNHLTGAEAIAYYDLRNRKTYIQVSNDETERIEALPTICMHVQIFQQDKGCSELNFEDELTPKDTVIYDMDNLIRNDGTPVPVNLDDDSYGYVTISAYECGDRNDDNIGDPLFGNVRILDDDGYEYRMNLITGDTPVGDLLDPRNEVQGLTNSVLANVIIPFNTVDGANQADIVGFIFENDRNISGSNSGPTADLVYNEDVGITFSVFQIDENEERLSCDQKTFGCGLDVTMNYGVNEDYPNSKGGPLLCEGAGLLPGQSNGFISLENATFLSPLDTTDSFEFVCLVGLNNGDGTGSMDTCQYKCVIDDDPNCGE